MTSSNDMLKLPSQQSSQTKIYRHHLDGIPRPVGPKHKNPSDWDREESRRVKLAMAELEKQRKKEANRKKRQREKEAKSKDDPSYSGSDNGKR